MKVKEAIEKLQKCDPEATIICYSHHDDEYFELQEFEKEPTLVAFCPIDGSNFVEFVFYNEE